MIWLAISADEYQLPVAVAGSARDLARGLGLKTTALYRRIREQIVDRRGNYVIQTLDIGPVDPAEEEIMTVPEDTPKMTPYVAENIRRKLAEHDVSVQMLAEWCDLKPSSIYHIVRPGSIVKTGLHLPAIARVLRTTVEWLREPHEQV